MNKKRFTSIVCMGVVVCSIPFVGTAQVHSPESKQGSRQLEKRAMDLENNAIAMADEYRKELSRDSADSKQLSRLRSDVERLVRDSFFARLKIHRARVEQNLRQLKAVQVRLSEREKNSESVIGARVSDLLAGLESKSQHVEAREINSGIPKLTTIAGPVYLGRELETGRQQLNPAWADRVEKKLQAVNSISVHDGQSGFVVQEIPQANRKRAELIGLVVVLMGRKGKVLTDQTKPNSLLIFTSYENKHLAAEILPRLPDYWKETFPVPAEGKINSESQSKANRLREEARATLKNAFEISFSNKVGRYESARLFFRLAFSMEREASFLSQATNLVDKSKEVQSEENSKKLAADAAKLLAKANVEATLRMEWSVRSNEKNKTRERAVQLARRYSQLLSENSLKEADEVKIELDRTLREADDDSLLITELESRAVVARLDGDHDFAEQCLERVRELDQAMEKRYRIDRTGARIQPHSPFEFPGGE